MEMRVAVSESGFKVTWADNHVGRWYNAYAPDGAHIAASYERADVLKACERMEAARRNGS